MIRFGLSRAVHQRHGEQIVGIIDCFSAGGANHRGEQILAAVSDCEKTCDSADTRRSLGELVHRGRRLWRSPRMTRLRFAKSDPAEVNRSCYHISRPFIIFKELCILLNDMSQTDTKSVPRTGFSEAIILNFAEFRNH